MRTRGGEYSTQPGKVATRDTLFRQRDKAAVVPAGKPRTGDAAEARLAGYPPT